MPATFLAPGFHNGFAPRDGEPLFPSLRQGLVGEWNPGLGPTGLRLHDTSLYKNHGTLTNMEPDADWVVSPYGYVLDFDGSNDYIALQASPAMPTAAPLTLAAWVLSKDNTLAYDVIGVYDAGSNIDWFAIAQSGNKFYAVARDDGGSPFVGNPQSGTFGVGVWNHVAAVFRAATDRSIFLNGLEVNETTSQSPSITTGTPSIGRAGDASPSGYANAKITDARIYNRALSAAEIQLLALMPGIANVMDESQLTAEQLAAATALANLLLLGVG